MLQVIAQQRVVLAFGALILLVKLSELDSLVATPILLFGHGSLLVDDREVQLVLHLFLLLLDDVLLAFDQVLAVRGDGRQVSLRFIFALEVNTALVLA